MTHDECTTTTQFYTATIPIVIEICKMKDEVLWVDMQFQATADGDDDVVIAWLHTLLTRYHDSPSPRRWRRSAKFRASKGRCWPSSSSSLRRSFGWLPIPKEGGMSVPCAHSGWLRPITQNSAKRRVAYQRASFSRIYRLCRNSKGKMFLKVYHLVKVRVAAKAGLRLPPIQQVACSTILYAIWQFGPSETTFGLVRYAGRVKVIRYNICNSKRRVISI